MGFPEIITLRPAVCHARDLRVGGAPRGGPRRRPVRSGRRVPGTLEIPEFGLTGAIAAGDLDGRLHPGGSPLNARDTLLPSPAREGGYTLAIQDRDFEDVSGLDVVLCDESEY